MDLQKDSSYLFSYLRLEEFDEEFWQKTLTMPGSIGVSILANCLYPRDQAILKLFHVLKSESRMGI